MLSSPQFNTLLLLHTQLTYIRPTPPMASGDNQIVTTATTKNNQNPFTQIQVKLKDLESGFKVWLEKQSLPVEAAVVTATSAVQGAFMGGLMGTITGDLTSAITAPPLPPNATINPQISASIKQAQALSGGPLMQARNFAVMTGVHSGIACVMKRVRGKEDLQTTVVAAFGSGAMFSLVSGLGAPNQAANVITSGLFFALMQAGIYKVQEGWNAWSSIKVAPQAPSQDLFYSKASSMLTSLGLERYQKNFKRGLLTDTTLPLLTDSALRDVNIPPGPRLLILDHIQRDPELKEKRK